ncbi:MAG: hypothetical protein EOO50_05820 [Flavobacterium sp.]|uniref:hypothetical protein n=1 Tax=Flavobacterium sp. TaxID=239 RepID=UPI0011F90B9D|nr:hypothetical protein [Flavobacterium sp.]RZJ67501.1 MAG: hypothetical protein EOO50_05820 [Flavobacterium sp.]
MGTSIGEIVFYVAIALIVIFIFVKILEPTKAEKEEERRLKESLSDEFLYDPETGARFTVEQAEKGTWIAHDNPKRIKSDEEINKYYSGSEIVVEQIANHLKSAGCERYEFTEEEISILSETKMLSNYDDWSYSSVFRFPESDDLVFFPTVLVSNTNRHGSFFRGQQMLFWLAVDHGFGHYYLRERRPFEKFFDLIKSDDEFEIDGMEVFTIAKSEEPLKTRHLLEKFALSQEIEIELNGSSLFVKTTDEPNLERFLELEKLLLT